MKVTEILKTADKHTPHDGYSWSIGGVHTCFGKSAVHIYQVREKNNSNAENDFQYYAIAPEMESKLREINKFMPQIKIAIQDAYSYRVDAVSKKGKKWATEYDALLKQIEGWENE